MFMDYGKNVRILYLALCFHTRVYFHNFSILFVEINDNTDKNIAIKLKLCEDKALLFLLTHYYICDHTLQ